MDYVILAITHSCHVACYALLKSCGSYLWKPRHTSAFSLIFPDIAPYLVALPRDTLAEFAGQAPLPCATQIYPPAQ